jgi:hypothetical protein
VWAVTLLQSAKTVITPSGKFQRFSRSRKVSPVALVHPVALVSLVVAALAVLRAAGVSPVLAMRWFSFVHEGSSPAMAKRFAPILNTRARGCRDGTGPPRVGSGKGAIPARYNPVAYSNPILGPGGIPTGGTFKVLKGLGAIQAGTGNGGSRRHPAWLRSKQQTIP